MLSVVVPVYNVEKYLKCCIDSILSQSYQNFELILVNDGSLDSSATICEQYASMDQRVKYISKSNKGLSDTRNVGIKVSEGDYVLFIDSDDMIAQNAFTEIVEAIEKYNNPDVLITEMTNTQDMNMDTDGMTLFSNPETTARDSVLQFVFGKKRHVYAAPQYICKREFLLNINLTFPAGYYHEDNGWTPKVLVLADSYGFYNRCWYLRRLDSEGSITNSPNCKRALDALQLTAENIDSQLFDSLMPETRRIMFSDMAISTFSNFSDFKFYSSAQKNELVSMIKENFHIYKYVNGTKFKLFVLLMQVFGINITLQLYSIIRNLKH